MLNKLLKHATIIVFSKLSSIFGSLFFVYFMSPEIYGNYVIYISLISYLSVFSGLNFNQAYGRYLYEEEKFLPENKFGGNIYLVILFFFVITSFISLPVFKHFLGSNLSLNLYIILTVISFTMIVETLLLQYCIKEDKLSIGLIYFFFRSFLLFIVLFTLVIFRFSLEFIFFIEAVASIIGMVFILIYLRFIFDLNGFLFSFKYCFKYSFPLLPYSFSLIVLAQFDRLLINNLFGSIITGIYSYIYNFGIVLSFLFGAFMNFANNEFYEVCSDFQKQSIFEIHQRKLYYKFIFISIFCVIFFYFFSVFFLPDDKKSVLAFLPIVIAAILILSVWQIWVRILGYFKKTYLIGIISFIAAAFCIIFLFVGFNFGLNFKFAYWVTLTSYLVMTVLGVVFVEKLDIRFVKPFFWDYLWIIFFLIISIISVFYLKVGILLFSVLFLFLLKFKFRYLKI